MCQANFGRVCIVELGNHTNPGVQRQCERQRQQAEFDLHDMGDRVGFEPVVR